MHRRCSHDELLEALARLPGLIPVDMDAGRGSLMWQDVGAFHAYEGFFAASLAMLAGLQRRRSETSHLERFETDIEVLDSAEVLTEFISPTAFIFHAGRCGSTALSKSLARSRAHMVFGEAHPHNEIWQSIAEVWRYGPGVRESARRRYEHLILAMGRRRVRTHRAHFVKFTSYNILLLDFIRSVFPATPALFLYRNPTAIETSLRRRPAPWASRRATLFGAFVAGTDVVESAAMEDSTYCRRALTRFFTAALGAAGPGLHLLDHAHLNQANLPAIVEALGVTVAADDLALMQSQLRYDAKQEHRLQDFHPGQESERPAPASRSTGDDIRTLYQRLCASEFNLLRGGGQNP